MPKLGLMKELSWADKERYLGALYGSSDGSNVVTLEGSWLEASLESYDEHATVSFDEAEDGIFEGS